MLDQAETLRQLVKGARGQSGAEIISIISGNSEDTLSFTMSLGASLALKGSRVLVLLGDREIGSIRRDSHFKDILKDSLNEGTLENYIIDGPFGVKCFQGIYDFELLGSIEDDRKAKILQMLQSYDDFDFILIYPGIGINRNVLTYIDLSDEAYVLTNPEINSIMETYALIKAISGTKVKGNLKLVVIGVEDNKSSDEVYNNIQRASKRFLNIQLGYGGRIIDKKNINGSNLRIEVQLKEPFLEKTLMYINNEDIQNIAGALLPSDMDKKGSLYNIYKSIFKVFS